MGTKVDDGGPAFPTKRFEVGDVLAVEGSWDPDRPPPCAEVAYPGMSLRDYFAAKAMAALVVNAGTVHPDVPLSMRAYEIADALLAERQK